MNLSSYFSPMLSPLSEDHTLIPPHQMTEEYLSLGREALDNGQPEEAMRHFQAAYALQPDNSEVIFYLGRASQDLNRHEDAVRYYAEVLKLESDCTPAMLNMANSYDDLGQREKAEQCYIDASNLDPSDPSVFYEWGKYYHRQQRNDEALACFEQASRLDPHDLNILEGRAEVFDDMGRFDEEVEVLRLVVVEDPQYVVGWTGLGWAYCKTGAHQAALEACRQAVALDPGDFEACRMLGFVYSEMHEYDTAIEHYEKAMTLDPDNDMVLVNIAFSLIQLDRYAEALPYCSRYLAHESDPVMWNTQGFALFHLGRLDEAKKCYEESLALDPRYEKALGNLADLYMAKKNWAMAEELYMKAYRLCPQERRSNLFDATDCQCNMHRYAEAKEHLLTLLPYAKEEELSVAYRLGFVCKQLHQFAEACDYYRLEMETFPDDPENKIALYNIALLEEKLEHYEACEEAWNTLIEMEDDLTERAFYQYSMGMFLGNIGRYDEAIDIIKEAIRNEKEEGLLADYYRTLADVYILTNAYLKALFCNLKAKILE